ncbi:MAG: isoprenyl transferase [Eubacteriales bacterium]|nr:isoprenyl transferase [Eubacteriales bacterium]
MRFKWSSLFRVMRDFRKPASKLSESTRVDGAKQASSDETGDSNIRIPQHVAVIMDGNGRWAKNRNLPRQAGHRAGAENLKALCRMCGNRGIKYLTVYAFSTENWSRPDDEVHALMNLFGEFFRRYDTELAAEGIRLRFIGDIPALPEDIRKIIVEGEANSINRDNMQLIVAFNYGGRREIVQACQKLALLVQQGELEPAAIDETLISQSLYLPDVPDPDLIIRPSGEMRLSNFLLWQCAYSEFWYSDVLWPDFSDAHLDQALEAYTDRNRRFGGVKSV